MPLQRTGVTPWGAGVMVRSLVANPARTRGGGGCMPSIGHDRRACALAPPPARKGSAIFE